MFFVDTYGGSQIGVVWKPSSLAPRPPKISNLYGRKWDKEKNLLHFDKVSALEGFHALGLKIVSSIAVKEGGEMVPFRW